MRRSRHVPVTYQSLPGRSPPAGVQMAMKVAADTPGPTLRTEPSASPIWHPLPVSMCARFWSHPMNGVVGGCGADMVLPVTMWMPGACPPDPVPASVAHRLPPLLPPDPDGHRDFFSAKTIVFDVPSENLAGKFGAANREVMVITPAVVTVEVVNTAALAP